MAVIGIDLGGTKIAAGVLESGVLKSNVTVPTPTTGGDEVIDAMAKAAKLAVEQAGVRASAIGLGSPGPLDFKTGVIKLAPNISGMTMFPIVDKLSAATGMPTYLENDANAAGLAEHHLGAAKGAASSLFITVSTGIGGGFNIGKTVWQGEYGQGAEIGHVTILPGGPICGCGMEGCLESVAAGRALEREASYAYKSEISTRDLFLRYQAGEQVAQRIVHQGARYVGIGLANFSKSFDPEVFVLGGGIALNGGDGWWDAMLAGYNHYMVGWQKAPILKAKLGSQSGLLGAALTAAVRIGEA